MKQTLALVLCILLLTGCSDGNEPLERGLQFREALLSSEGCSFTAEVTADYEEYVQSFTLACVTDGEGNLSFTVVSPETISGITGTIDAQGGKLTFDDTVLGFPLLAGKTLSPVSAPWILVNTLRSGYLTSACGDSDLLRLSMDDSYRDDALQLDIWLDSENVPVQAEILYDGRRILSLILRDFSIL